MGVPAKSFDADVIVVGGGPCGLVLAQELGRRGVRTIVINDRPGISPHPQANATQARTMEHYRRLGFAGRVRAAGLPPDYWPDVAYFTRLSGYELARFEQPSSSEAEELVRAMSGSWSVAELPHRCSQMYIERIMFEEAEKLSSVDLRFGWRAAGFKEHDDRVELEAVLGSGVREHLTSRYLVGADGPRSAIRKQLGIGYQGRNDANRRFMGGQMYSIYFRSPDFYEVVPYPQAWQYWTVNSEQRGLLVALDGRRSFVFQVQLEREAGDAMSAAEAREILFQAMGRPFDIEVLAVSPWRAGLTLVAERFQAGRVFLAGDAVHLFTPTGGLGYNTTVEDAVNIGWKLAAVINGWGGEELLSSYEPERVPVARRNTRFARGFAESVGGFEVPREIEDDSAAGDVTRARVGGYLGEHARNEFNIPGITLGARYDGSPSIVPDGTRPPIDTPHVYQPSACPGGRAPHAWLADGRSLYDVFGFDFTLLKLSADGDSERPLVGAAAAAGIPLQVADVSAEGLRGLYEADLALVRPDQVVCWRGDRIPADAGALLGKVTGRSDLDG